ncbi:MAG: hypothetical protein ACJAYP_000238 [Flavobacterium sp.]|jgi:hypothetical protein
MNSMNEKFVKEFESKFSYLSFESLKKFAKNDYQINNVLRGLNKECFALIKENENFEDLTFIYLINSLENSGCMLRLKYREPLFYYYLLGFSLEITRYNKNLETITIYNTFIQAFRTYLENNQIITFLSKEIDKYKNGIFLSPEDVEIIKSFDRVKFYRGYLGEENYSNFNDGKMHVYLLINTEDFTFKIGQSTKPKYREGTLQSKQPSVHILKAWECDKKIEQELHKIYQKNRIRGEWFKFDFAEFCRIDETINNLIKNQQ